MSITQEQKEFIKSRLENIYENPTCDIEVFIKNNLIGHEKNKLRTTRLWLQEDVLDNLPSDKIKELITYISNEHHQGTKGICQEDDSWYRRIHGDVSSRR